MHIHAHTCARVSVCVQKTLDLLELELLGVVPGPKLRSSVRSASAVLSLQPLKAIFYKKHLTIISTSGSQPSLSLSLLLLQVNSVCWASLSHLDSHILYPLTRDRSSAQPQPGMDLSIRGDGRGGMFCTLVYHFLDKDYTCVQSN